jgi:predicted MPP superfamily phosphohydrolase
VIGINLYLLCTCTIFFILFLYLSILYEAAKEKNLYVVYASSNNLSNFNFVAVGDWDCNRNTNETIHNIIGKNPELVLGLGDYSYKPTADCWLSYVKPIEAKMKIVLGNHEIPRDERDEKRDHLSESSSQDFRERFNLTTQQYYSFNRNNIHFVALSTEISQREHSRQKSFVENDLSKASSDPNIDWIIVYFHKPFYALPGSHDPEEGLRKIYHPIFTKYDVDLVLQGHIHNYQRSYPITYNNNSIPSGSITVVDNQRNTYDDPEGQIFVIAGTAGARLYDVIGNPCTDNNQNHNDDDYDYMICGYKGLGFLNVDLTNDGESLNATFFANDNNTVIDQFTIAKHS